MSVLVKSKSRVEGKDQFEIMVLHLLLCTISLSFAFMIFILHV